MTGASPQRLKWFAADVDLRAGSRRASELALMSVSAYWGVRRRDEITNDPPRAESLDNYKICRSGDIVINKMSAYQGAFGVSPSDGLVSPDYAVLRPSVSVDPRWLVYSMKTPHFMSEISNRLRGIGDVAAGNVRTPRISMTDLLDISWPIPAYEEQRRTADFLDRETAQIDALIAKQEQFIGLLGERRQAVIDRAFQPFAGNRVQLRRAIRYLTSGSRGWGDYYADHGERFLRIGNLPRRSLVLRGEVQFVQLPPGVSEGSRTRLRKSDLLFSITAYLGSVAVVDDEWVDAYVSQHVALCRLDLTMLDPRYVGHFMLTTEGQDQLNEGAAGGTKMQLALDDIRGLTVPFVALGEQRRVVGAIESATARIDALIAKASEHIALARERRAALITEAVTGRIDVSSGRAA